MDNKETLAEFERLSESLLNYINSFTPLIKQVHESFSSSFDQRDPDGNHPHVDDSLYPDVALSGIEARSIECYQRLEHLCFLFHELRQWMAREQKQRIEAGVRINKVGNVDKKFAGAVKSLANLTPDQIKALINSLGHSTEAETTLPDFVTSKNSVDKDSATSEAEANKTSEVGSFPEVPGEGVEKGTTD